MANDSQTRPFMEPREMTPARVVSPACLDASRKAGGAEGLTMISVLGCLTLQEFCKSHAAAAPQALPGVIPRAADRGRCWTGLTHLWSLYEVQRAFNSRNGEIFFWRLICSLRNCPRFIRLFQMKAASHVSRFLVGWCAGDAFSASAHRCIFCIFCTQQMQLCVCRNYFVLLHHS